MRRLMKRSEPTAKRGEARGAAASSTFAYPEIAYPFSLARKLLLAPGVRLGPYAIVSALGAGGMGEVYKARDTRLDRTVAIKVLPEHVASDPELKQRFEREAKAISSLNHGWVILAQDDDEEDDLDDAEDDGGEDEDEEDDDYPPERSPGWSD